MRKAVTALLSAILISGTCMAQYADMGVGNLKNGIWWIDWAGFNMENGATKTVTTNTGTAIKITFSKVTGPKPSPTIMNSWPGSTLHLMYNFSNPAVKPALRTIMTPQKTEFTLSVTVTKNGIPVPFTFVVADAEASAPGEQIRLKTNFGVWNTIEFFRNSTQTTNPVEGCGTNNVTISQTFHEEALPQEVGQNAILATVGSSASPLEIDVVFDKQPPHGASALAFGILEPVDRGDLPATYGYAHHALPIQAANSCNFNPPFPTTRYATNLYLGAVPPDADPTESLDDNAVGVDEEAFSDFPEYDGSGSYTLEVPLVNQTSKTAMLTAWFDFDRSGSFNPYHKASVSVPAGATAGVLTWTGLPQVLNAGSKYALRFRLSTGGIDDPTGYAPDGEVEDYYVRMHQKRDSVIINHYAAVIGSEICENRLDLDDAKDFNIGDTVLIIQMKGAVIDSSNSAAFGTVKQYGNAGNYELNIIRSKSGNTVYLENVVTRDFDFQKGKVQLVRVPYFSDYRIEQPLTAMPWDGKKGGVLFLNASGTVTMHADIDVSGKGFRHGPPLKSTLMTYNATGYYYNAISNNGGEKGEGVAEVGRDKMYGRGALANGGGGGNSHNAGGGGGGNGGKGGQGGDQFQPYKAIAEQIGGKGGFPLVNSATLNRLFLGGAGGMGHENEDTWFPAGNGGGIAIISANMLTANSFSIKANGGNATEAPTVAASKDGMPGGGAGGTIFLDIASSSGALILEAKGGKGADQPSSFKDGKFGPGGGGGGGMIIVSQPSVPAAYTPHVSGGINGTNTSYGNDALGAEAGQPGIVISNMKPAIATIPFKVNIESVQLEHSLSDCHLVKFTATPVVNHTPVVTWKWDFGDDSKGTNAFEAAHDYYGEGEFNVSLTVTDQHGCEESVTKVVQTFSPTIEVSPDVSICKNESVQLFAKGGNSYQWTPASFLDADDIAEPIATPPATMDFRVTAKKAEGCIIEKNIRVTVNELPDLKIAEGKTVCLNATTSLMASGGTSYSWKPDSTLSATDIPNPSVTATRPHTYVVTATNEFGCEQTGSVHIDLFPIQKINALTDPLICKNSTATLSATGGSSFVWAPASLVENPSGQWTATTPLRSDTTFYLTVTDQYACTYTDSVRIKLKPEAVFHVSADQAICSGEKVTLSASGGDHYSWTPTGFIDLPSASSVSVSPTESTTFAVTISENACGKTETLYTTVQIRPGPTVIATSSNDINCQKPFAHLSASGNGRSFVWSTASDGNISSGKNAVVNPKQTTRYTVTAEDQFGCLNSDSVLVRVNRNDEPFAGLPNAFTPNGDGLNDCFGVKTLGYLHEVDFKVYNRFGQIVFHTNNPNDCWDGTFKGEPQNAGAFVYVVSGRTECSDINLKGIIMLIR